jgi:hypothetical protein
VESLERVGFGFELRLISLGDVEEVAVVTQAELGAELELGRAPSGVLAAGAWRAGCQHAG